jgi:hypothetical protein
MSDPAIDNCDPVTEHNELLKCALTTISVSSDLYGRYCPQIAAEAVERIRQLEAFLYAAHETIAVAQRLLELVDLDDAADQADYERVMAWGGEEQS